MLYYIIIVCALLDWLKRKIRDGSQSSANNTKPKPSKSMSPSGLLQLSTLNTQLYFLLIIEGRCDFFKSRATQASSLPKITIDEVALERFFLEKSKHSLFLLNYRKNPV